MSFNPGSSLKIPIKFFRFFGSRALFMPTVYEDVMFGPKNYGYDKEEVKERTEAALSMVHSSKNIGKSNQPVFLQKLFILQNFIYRPVRRYFSLL